MKPAHKIKIQDWMKAPQTRAVMNALNKGAAEPQALFVGGCVRNALLGEAVGDIDIATVLTPDAVTQKLEAAGIKVIPTGLDHGTVTAALDGRSFEITTLRKDVSTDGRRATVAFTTDWREDAQRRDFTINTLLMDEDGQVFDPLGQALRDINPPRIVFVGDPAQRIAEDYLRILRFFRFHAWYGDEEMEEDALKAIAAAADKIATLSKERITQEFFKLLAAPDPAPALKAMFDAGVLKSLAPAPEVYGALSRLCALQNQHGQSLAARLYSLGGKCAEFMILPKVLQAQIKAINEVLAMPALETDHGIKVALYRQGREAAIQALMILQAQEKIAPTAFSQNLKTAQEWNIPVFPITGDDLIAQGYQPGPALGEKLKTLEQEWIENGFAMTVWPLRGV